MTIKNDEDDTPYSNNDQTSTNHDETNNPYLSSSLDENETSLYEIQEQTRYFFTGFILMIIFFMLINILITKLIS